MNPLSLLHLVAAAAALVIGFIMVRLPKGNHRHRVFGWWYVGLMSIGLIGILIRRWRDPHPFLAYAVMILIVLAIAVAVLRGRKQLPTWRAWHGSLMALTLLGATLAASSVVGGALIGDGSGAPFYRLFNVLIAFGTLAGLGIINTRRVLWGQTTRVRAARWWYSTLVIASSAALIAGQWPMAFPKGTPTATSVSAFLAGMHAVIWLGSP
jgi:uncharacterized membrane protein